MKLNTQIRLVSIILIIAISGFAIGYQKIDANNYAELKSNEYLNEIYQGIFELNIITDDYLQTNKKRARVQWERRHASLTNVLLRADTLISNKESKGVINRLRKNLIKSRKIFFSLTVLLGSGENYSSYSVRPIAEQIHKLSLQSSADATYLIKNATTRLYESRHQLLQIEISLILVFILFVVLVVVWVGRSLIMPLIKLRKQAIHIAEGDYGYQVEVSGNNEVSDLANSINQLSHEIKNKIESLVNQADILSREKLISESAFEKLKQTENKYKKIHNTALDAIVTIDNQGVIQSINPSVSRIFGYSEEELIDKNVTKLMPNDIADMHQGYIDHYIETGEAKIIGIGREIQGVHKTGKKIPLFLNIIEFDLDGEAYFCGMLRDLSAEKEVEEARLRRSQKMDALGKLTGGVAHDYNNMLGVVMGYTEMLMENLKDQPKLYRYANEVYTAADRGVKLTGKLLEFSRHKPSERGEITNINDLINSSHDMLKTTLTARIDILLDLNDELWNVEVNRSDFENALLNLCINSMHAIEGNGTIRITTNNSILDDELSDSLDLSSGEYVMLAVQDDGCGMDIETQSHALEPFYTTKNTKGTGLGLSQVYGFTQRTNGTIKIYSEIGLGTRVIVYLPRFIDVSETILHEFVPEIEHDDKNEHLKGKGYILVVDDEEALCELAKHHLENNGYVVYIATSGEDALTILENNEIDLLLSDVVMPKMDGYKLADSVTNLYPNIIIQLVSGFNDQNIININRPYASNIITKPYSYSELSKRVYTLLNDG